MYHSKGKALGPDFRPALYGALLFCLLLPYAHAAGLMHGRTSHLHRTIENLEEQWREAVLSRNIEAMDRLLADDYIGIEPNGMIETKTQAIDRWKNHEVQFDRMDLSELHVRIYGDTAVVNSKARVEGHNRSGPMDGEYRYTRVYHLQNGQWQVVSFEANRISHPHPGDKP
jgi:ketosteroid isomerase-like protein